ncbi:hypothetical protein EDD36DRAFT_415582 [Exophiala viscosa]|uniref:Zn(2)-C6 fungal-type domain-containing protein n=1 Tax=Exophiala viscosa TaxID=2486360 RepID=A0AAN6E2H5_9EURO|nr:hypothetical protein EDD36DRAFT_415582 [Exophiala viscosa]
MIRIGTHKVRTGCITCKRRHVKCDEGRPRCARCIKAGRACEGYANSPGSGEPFKFVVYTPHGGSHLLSGDPDLDWSERRSLSYFQDRTALELAGGFHTDFWLSSILPLAQHEVSVRHALIALSSMHEHYAGVDHFAPTRGINFALDHYGKAIREVVRLSRSPGGQNFDSALVTSALFSAFESLQGHYHTACNHAISGMKMLAEEQRSIGLVGPRHARVPRDELVRFFTATGRQILELGDPNFHGPRPALMQGRPSMPDKFTSFEQAMLHMELMLTDLFEWAEQADSLAMKGPIAEDIGNQLMLEYVKIKEYSTRWSAAFTLLVSEFESSSPESTSSEETTPVPRPPPPTALLLKLYQALLTAFLRRIEVADEKVLKEYTSDFWLALDLAEDFIQQTSQLVTSPVTPADSTSSAQPKPARVVRPTFSLAMGVVPTLFLIATRGGDMAVRNRAIQLLKTCYRREGFWDSRIAASLAERIFDIQKLIIEKYGEDAPVVLQLLDIAFMPGRRCVFKYRLEGPHAPTEEGNTPQALWAGHASALDNGKEYYEQLKWEG